MLIDVMLSVIVPSVIMLIDVMLIDLLLSVIVLSVIMLIDVMLSVIVPSVIMLIDIMLSVIVPSVIMLIDFMLSVIVPSVIMLMEVMLSAIVPSVVVSLIALTSFHSSGGYQVLQLFNHLIILVGTTQKNFFSKLLRQMRLQHDLGKCYKTFLSSLMPLLAKPGSKSNEYMMILAQIMKKNYIKTFLAQLMPLSA
jgi:hypothetical protein